MNCGDNLVAGTRSTITAKSANKLRLAQCEIQALQQVQWGLRVPKLTKKPSKSRRLGTYRLRYRRIHGPKSENRAGGRISIDDVTSEDRPMPPRSMSLARATSKLPFN